MLAVAWTGVAIWLLALLRRLAAALEATIGAADQRIDRLKDEVIEQRRHTERSDVREQSDRDAIITLEGQMQDRPRRRTDRG